MATICSYMLLNTGKEKEGIEMASNATNQIKSNQIKFPIMQVSQSIDN